LVEHNVANVVVVGSKPITRSEPLPKAKASPESPLFLLVCCEGQTRDKKT
jgi:hypothetical protein